MKTNRAHLRPQIPREFVFAVDGFGPRCDLAVAELAHGFAQLIDLKSEIEIERRITCSSHIRHRLERGMFRLPPKSSKHKRPPKIGVMESWSIGMMVPPVARSAGPVALSGFGWL